MTNKIALITGTEAGAAIGVSAVSHLQVEGARRMFLRRPREC